MNRRFATIFNDFEEVHLTKDVGMIPMAMSAYSAPLSSILYYWDKTGNPIDNPYQDQVRLIGIKASCHLEFLVKLVSKSMIDKVGIINLYHIRYQTLLLVLVFKILRKKIYIKLDLDNHEHERLKKNWSMPFRAKTMLTKWIVSLANCVSVENIDIYNSIKPFNFLKKNLVYMPNSILPSTVTKNPPSYQNRKNQILVVGRIGSYQKNHELIIRALEMLPAPLEWKIFLTGPADKSFEINLDKFRKENPDKSECVVLLGNKSRKEIFNLYAECKAFLMPSRWEGFSLALLEAAYMGCYIIATDVGGARVLTKNWAFGRMISQDNALELSQVLLDLSKDHLINEISHEHRLAFVRENFNLQTNIKTISSKLALSRP